MSRSAAVVTLALQLQAADAYVADVQDRVSRVIAGAMPGWLGDWEWLRPAGIEVYGVAACVEIERANATLALHAAGFADVRFHDHSRARILSCSCKWRIP